MTTCQDSPGMLIVAAIMQWTNTVSASSGGPGFTQHHHREDEPNESDKNV